MSARTAMSSEEKAHLAYSVLEGKKAIELVRLDVRGRTLMTDFLVIASGTSDVHIKATVDAVIEKFSENGIKNKRVEGYEQAAWVLMDYGDVIIHVFAQEQREFYRLESYWTGSEKSSPPPLSSEER